MCHHSWPRCPSCVSVNELHSVWKVATWYWCAIPLIVVDPTGYPPAFAIEVELDAVEPNQLRQLCTDSINDCFDPEKYDELMDIEKEEKAQYVAELKNFVKTL